MMVALCSNGSIFSTGQDSDVAAKTSEGPSHLGCNPTVWVSSVLLSRGPIDYSCVCMVFMYTHMHCRMQVVFICVHACKYMKMLRCSAGYHLICKMMRDETGLIDTT